MSSATGTQCERCHENDRWPPEAIGEVLLMAATFDDAADKLRTAALRAGLMLELGWCLECAKRHGPEAAAFREEASRG